MNQSSDDDDDYLLDIYCPAHHKI